MKTRRYDIDWLRVIAMLVVFIFHCTRFFCNEDWHLKVPVAQQSELLGLLRTFFVSVWFMEIFFLVSGFATSFALRRRSAGQYLVERVKRLLVPLYTVGLFILVAPQAYFEYFTHGKTGATFWQWLPGFYAKLPADVLGIAPQDVFDPIFLVPYTFSGHLWFIQMLFLVAVLTLPVLLFLRSERGQRQIARLAGWCARPGGIFVFVIPLAVVQLALRWLPETTDRTWADFFWYALFFVIGYLIAADERFTESIKRHGWLGLGLWVVVFWGVGGLYTLVLGIDPSSWPGFSALYVLWQIAWSVVSWGAIVFILSLGAKYLNFTNRFLTYANEAVLPFYLFHQTVILVVGWFVLPLAISNLARFLVIALVSFPTILVLYEVFVRHIGFMRFLFGMTPKQKQPAPEARLKLA